MTEEANVDQSAFEQIDFQKPALIKSGLAKVAASNAALSALRLDDDDLVLLRTRYVLVHAKVADRFQLVAGLLERIERASANEQGMLELEVSSYSAELEALEKRSLAVIDELNVYCTGSK